MSFTSASILLPPPGALESHAAPGSGRTHCHSAGHCHCPPRHGTARHARPRPGTGVDTVLAPASRCKCPLWMERPSRARWWHRRSQSPPSWTQRQRRHQQRQPQPQQSAAWQRQRQRTVTCSPSLAASRATMTARRCVAATLPPLLISPPLTPLPFYRYPHPGPISFFPTPRPHFPRDVPPKTVLYARRVKEFLSHSGILR